MGPPIEAFSECGDDFCSGGFSVRSCEARVWISVATDKMTVRALYFFVLGFSGLFAMQGCGGDEAAAETTAAAEGTTASP